MVVPDTNNNKESATIDVWLEPRCLMGSILIFFYSFRSNVTFDQMFLYYILFHFLIGILSVISLPP